MAKPRKRVLPGKYSSAGYNTWDVRRTIREAENVSRWNPWLSHAWMEEALDQLCLEKPFFTEYDNAVDRINTYWLVLLRMHWFDEAEFWRLGDELCVTTLLNKSNSY